MCKSYKKIVAMNNLIVRFWKLFHWLALKKLKQNGYYATTGDGTELYLESLE